MKAVYNRLSPSQATFVDTVNSTMDESVEHGTCFISLPCRRKKNEPGLLVDLIVISPSVLSRQWLPKWF